MSVPNRPTILFVTGSDTDVGKTYVASLLARQLRHSGKRVGVYKPVASGCVQRGDQLESDDAIQLWHAAGCPLELEAVCPQRFLAPLAPHQAARLEGRVVDGDLLVAGAQRWLGHCEVLIVEGAGGLLSPLSETQLNMDLAMSLAPVNLLVVVANRLGAIHQALATCRAAEHGGLKPSGLVLCETLPAGVPSVSSARDHNALEIAKFTDVPVLAQLDYDSDHRIAIENCLPPLANDSKA